MVHPDSAVEAPRCFGGSGAWFFPARECLCKTVLGGSAASSATLSSASASPSQPSAFVLASRQHTHPCRHLLCAMSYCIPLSQSIFRLLVSILPCPSKIFVSLGRIHTKQIRSELHSNLLLLGTMSHWRTLSFSTWYTLSVQDAFVSRIGPESKKILLFYYDFCSCAFLLTYGQVPIPAASSHKVQSLQYLRDVPWASDCLAAWVKVIVDFLLSSAIGPWLVRDSRSGCFSLLPTFTDHSGS